MICEPSGPCGAESPWLDREIPVPGMATLQRRLGNYWSFLADLVARTEQRDVEGEPLGRAWDIEGDPDALKIVDLWAFVAEGVAAYTELAAGEAYLATARDWLDLARLADHVGYRPAQRVAAEGWVRFDTDRTNSPMVPAGTRVQASGTPTRDPQTFEVVADTQLSADWAGLTATWVPEPAKPDGRYVRFLGDPGFRAGEQVLLIEESVPPPVVDSGWLGFLQWLFTLLGELPSSTLIPLAVVNVVGHETELGTTLVEFDRNVDDLLGKAPGVPYAAYRILDNASTARRIKSVLHIDEDGEATSVGLSYTEGQDVYGDNFAVLDRELPDLSTDRLVAVVHWGDAGARGDVARIHHHVPVQWEVVPGTEILVSKLTFAEEVPALAPLAGTTPQRSVYVLDRRVVLTHHIFPATQPADVPGAGLQLRVWPAPTTPEPPSRKLAVETVSGASTTWELLDVAASASVEVAADGSDLQPGLLLDVIQAPVGTFQFAAASGNVVGVRHGTTVRSVLPGGDGVTPDQAVQLPDSPVAAVLDASGTPVSSVDIVLDGRRWSEQQTLFDAGTVDEFEARFGAEGEAILRFGDGVDGAIPPSGANNLVATYRVGGGTTGEVGPGEIDTLLGSIRGVRAVEGAGPTTGGANQPTESALRREAPTRARALDRIVSLGDVADLALAFPGVSHATAWLGHGPITTSDTGPHVAILRTGTAGARRAENSELEALSLYLDARRDTTLPLSVVTAEVIVVSLDLIVVVDAQLVASLVEAAIVAALTDPAGVLTAEQRALGQPLDRSDVTSVVHGVPGVVGVTSMTMASATADSSSSVIGRLPADRHELLVLGVPNVQAVTS